MFSSSFILSPLSQFEVNSLIGFNAPVLGFFNLSLTNLGLYTLFTLFLILGLHIYGNNDSKLIPSPLYRLKCIIFAFSTSSWQPIPR